MELVERLSEDGSFRDRVQPSRVDAIKAKFRAPEDVGPSSSPPQRLLPEVPGPGRLVELPPPPQLPELELLEFIPAPRPPLHVVSANRDGSPAPQGVGWYSVGCSCGWFGRQIADGPDRTEDDVIDILAREWRAHVRLSERVWRRSKKFRLAANGELANRNGGW